MANVYRRKDSKNWTADLVDHHSRRWRVSLLRDRTASEQVARDLERLVASYASTGRTEPDMLKMLRRLPPDLYRKVQERGLVDVEADGMRLTVEQHLDAWASFLAGAGRTQLQAKQQRMRAATLLDGCRRLADVVPERIQRRLEDRRIEQQWSQRTRNGYLKAAQQFERWLVKQGRATGLGLTQLDALRVTEERERRALTPEEAGRLLAYCEDAPRLAGRTWSLTGEERRLLYLVALKTGLRANELRQLRRADVDVEAATLTVRAAVAKSRKSRRLPLPAELMEVLAPHCMRLHPGASLWRLPGSLHRQLLKPDAEACGIALVDAEGRHLDFHALRHTFATWLDQHAGASTATAQNLLGHADVRTTQRYVHAGLAPVREAAERLPVLVRQLAATGTDDRRIIDRDNRDSRRDKLVALAGSRWVPAETRNAPGGALGAFRTRPAGLEPATFGFVDRAETASEVGTPAAPKPEDLQGLEAGTALPSAGIHSTDRDSRRDKHDADLARLQALWPKLPAHVRAGLVAMAAASVEARP